MRRVWENYFKQKKTICLWNFNYFLKIKLEFKIFSCILSGLYKMDIIKEVEIDMKMIDDRAVTSSPANYSDSDSDSYEEDMSPVKGNNNDSISKYFYLIFSFIFDNKILFNLVLMQIHQLS